MERPSTGDLAIAGELRNLGWEIHIIAHRVKGGKSPWPQAVKKHSLPLGVGYPLTYGAFVTAAPLILSIRPLVIHAHGLSTHGILAAVYRRFLRFRRTVLSITGPDVEKDATTGLTRWSAEHALRMFETVITPGDKGLLESLSRLNPPKDRLVISDAAGTPEARAAELAALYEGLISPTR